MSANSPVRAQWPDDEQQPSSKAYALSGKIMLASIITLFVIVFFLVLLHLYARWYLTRLNRRNNDTRHPNRHNRPTRMVYYIANSRVPASGSAGLDGSILKSLPLFSYSAETKTNEDVVDCAVCLSEFEEGETGRVLPNCKHCFHIECIDMWFCSHSTCPLCRSPVEPVQTDIIEVVPEPGSSTSLMETTSSGDRMKRVDVRIDVPVNESVTESELRMTSPSQGFRSPGSRLLSLKRIINMGRISPSSGVGPSCEPVVNESSGESARNESDHESRRPG